LEEKAEKRGKKHLKYRKIKHDKKGRRAAKEGAI
jgi:hypothetical protein